MQDVSISNGSVKENGPTTPQQEAPAPQESTLSVRVTETGVIVEDKNRFEDIIRLLLNHKGPHPFVLEVETGERLITLEMPFQIQPCDELVSNLSELIGETNVTLAGTSGSNAA